MSIFGRSQEDADRPRSAEERERARQEREARRAAREGRPAPLVDEAPAVEPSPAVEEPVAGEPVAAEPVFEEPTAVEPAEPVISHEVEEPEVVAERPAFEDEPAVDEPPAFDAEPAVEEAPAYEEPPAAEDPPAVEDPQETAEWDPLAEAPKQRHVPSASAAGGVDTPTTEWDVMAQAQAERATPVDDEPRVKRLTPAGSRTGTPDDGAPAAATPAPLPPPRVVRPTSRFGDEHERPVPPKRVTAPRSGRTLPPPPPPPGERRSRPSRRRRNLLLLLVPLLLVLALAGWLYNAIYQPFAGDGGQRVRVTIPSNSTASGIGQLLEREGVIGSSTFFTLRTRLEGESLKAGTYSMREDMPYGDAIETLGAGPRAARTISLTIPEGRSRRETRPLVDQAGLRGSYLAASERERGFRPRRYGAPRGVASLEGFLFPATYELRPNATADQLVKKQLDAFEKAIAEVPMQRARRRNLTTYDVLIIASMVEREATLAKERPVIAAVIHNRLREGMPLGIDATIRFATRNWSRPLRVSELQIDSPYNTRTNTGLPPGPIGSPGLDSIKAAANPANVDYLFYVVKPSGDGAHNFSSTDAEFQRDVAAYKREQERRGGDPSSSE